MLTLAKIAVVTGILLMGQALACPQALAQSNSTIVEIETPLASAHPLQGYLRRPNGAGTWPAVILLHSCNGSWQRIDERWGKRIAGWGYVTLSVDSFGPRGIKTGCRDRPSADFTSDATHALNFLAGQSSVDAARIAVVGFAWGGFSSLTSVERVTIPQGAPNKFGAAAAFCPPCASLKGDMTVPTLILTGARDEVNSADECLKLVSGRSSWGISRQANQGVPIQLVVYPDAHHGFDAPKLESPHRDRNIISSSTKRRQIKRPGIYTRFWMQQSAEMPNPNSDQRPSPSTPLGRCRTSDRLRRRMRFRATARSSHKSGRSSSSNTYGCAP
ncbi:dienelactone hydrolase [Bradyrhizobium sp. LB11.1]